MFPVHHSVFYCRRWILKLCSDLYLGGQSCLFSSHLATIKRSVSDGLHLCYICRMCNSVCLSNCTSVLPSVCPSPFFRPFFRPPIRATVQPPVKTSTCPTIYPPTHLSNHKPNHPPICLCALRLCLSVLTPTNQPTHLFPVLARTIIVFRYLPSFLGCPLRYYYCCWHSFIYSSH